LSTVAAPTRRLGVKLLGLTLVSVLALAGCEAQSPPRGIEATCAKACEVRISQCEPRQCRRGCNLVMDRLAENEGDHVLTCVAEAKTSCDDRAWARCATRIGPHADGGPPPPPPPPGVFEQEGD
jgi:hypothetical protein